jgi:diguanylate cyclase (GGDEF)-like protein
VVILPEKKKARTIELAERLRRKIKKLNIRIEKRLRIKVNASFGIASLKKDTDKEAFLKEADAFLYKAKAGGRKMVMPQLKLLSEDLQIH